MQILQTLYINPLQIKHQGTVTLPTSSALATSHSRWKSMFLGKYMKWSYYWITVNDVLSRRACLFIRILKMLVGEWLRPIGRENIFHVWPWPYLQVISAREMYLVLLIVVNIPVIRQALCISADVLEKPRKILPCTSNFCTSRSRFWSTNHFPRHSSCNYDTAEHAAPPEADP